VNVPLRYRFRANFDRDLHAGGWYFRLFLGFPALMVYWKYPSWNNPWTFITGVQIGWMLPSLQEGQTFPCKQWLRTRLKPQEWKS